MPDAAPATARQFVKRTPIWTWPHGPSLRYCLKTALATALGYACSWGGPESAVYGAMGAALIVGASRGEDIISSSNRVRGTLAGMVVGVAMAFTANHTALPPMIAVSTGIGITAYLCVAFGLGVPAVRIGAAFCAVMVLVHGADALDYSAVRVGNTLIGVIAGLVVSHFVLTVTGRDAVSSAMRNSLLALADLLSALSKAEQPLPLTLHVAMLDRVVELEKAIRDAAREFRAGRNGFVDRDAARQVAAACAGALTAAIAHSDICASAEARERARPLLVRAAALAVSARSAAADKAGEPPHGFDAPAVEFDDPAAGDAVALQGLALGLRKIEAALDAMRGHSPGVASS